jgi:tetratricopeptide (TPR) repeat protein
VRQTAESARGPGPELIGRVAQDVAARLLPHGEDREAHLGDIFLACERVARRDPAGWASALAEGRLPDFLIPQVQGELASDAPERLRGGWLGTYVGADGREIEAESEPTADPAALELGRRALQRALSHARAKRNETLQRYLRWYELRLARKSYAAIARRENRPSATIRTGVARARRLILRMVHELQHDQPAPLSGDAPAEIEPLRDLWVRQQIDELERGLERTRERFGDDPHWLNLFGLLRADRGERESALEAYERALVFADAPSVRARVLNNLGNLYEDLGRAEDARESWLRAHQLLPDAPAPLLNLLADASQARDYASAQLYVSELGERLSAGSYADADRAYLLRRLAENPKLAWLRETDAWRLGPARWLRSARRGRALRDSGVLLLLLFALLAPSTARAGSAPSAGPGERPSLEAIRAQEKGGDSMGSPPRDRGRGSLRVPLIFAGGDSMGFKPRKGRRQA